MADSRTFDAVIVADGPHAEARVAGLSLRERARRVALKAGARRVHVIARDADRAALAAWWREGRAGALLVVRGADQVVHTPLVAPLVERGDTALAVTPDGAYAGAIFAAARDADDLVAALAEPGSDDRALAARLAPRAAAVPHGDIARHPATTPDERRAAAQLLYRIVHKPQDSEITRYLFRPVSFPLTRAFLRTPITPNQISYLTAILLGVGIWLTARGPMNDAVLGTALVLAATYVDCCDGEVARLKLLSSRFGAWLDTVIDELGSIGYMLALGWHCHRYFGPDYLGELGFDPWLAGLAVGFVAYALSIYFVYYNIIVVVGSANSQDYVGRFQVVPGDAPGTVRLRPAASEPIATHDLPPLLRFLATYAPYIVRRDFISWSSMIFALVHLTQLMFGFLVLGGLISVTILTVDHVRLLRQRRAITRAGQVLVVR